MAKKRPPNWERFHWWVLASSALGLGIAVGVFFLLRRYVFGGNDDVGDIISGTATALGALTIGGIAIMQYRKHKWAEYQAKLDEDSRTGERLSKAIEHLGDEKEPIRLGAVYEFKNLAEDSPRNKVNIVQILTAFIKSYVAEEGKDVPQDIEAAARVLSQLVRELIEEAAEKMKMRKGLLCLSNHDSVIDATKTISNIPPMEDSDSCGSFIKWRRLKANQLYLAGIVLKKAFLSYANFAGAELLGANLQGAELWGANLKRAKLWDVNLHGASLQDANLQGARLQRVNLQGADLRGAKIDGIIALETCFIDEHTLFDPGIREKYFPDFGKENDDPPKG